MTDKLQFPDGFLLMGWATAANQCEGAYNEDGRGQCGCGADWDRHAIITGKKMFDGHFYPAKDGIDIPHR